MTSNARAKHEGLLLVDDDGDSVSVSFLFFGAFSNCMQDVMLSRPIEDVTICE